MTPAEAARLLDLAPDATPQQLEARFLELRARFEDKIAKAPTPGLKEKYRASLVEITEAFETLTLAADGDSLPVLERAVPSVGRVVPNALSGTAAPASSSSPRATQAPAKAKSNREFLLVALIAVIVLGAGGWWIVKTRAENVERARQAELAKSEAERLAAEQKQREADEKSHSEAEFARLRAAQAELKIRWETIEREAGSAERRLSELKSDARSADRLPAPEQAELKASLEAQTDFVDWLQPTLARHPARTLLARFDALLSTKALPEAAATERELAEALAKFDTELGTQRDTLLTLGKEITFTSEPEGLAVELRDAYGRSFKGRTPAKLELPWGPTAVLVASPGTGWARTETTLTVRRDTEPTWSVRYGKTTATITSTPSGLPFELTNSAGLKRTGTTPAELADLPNGSVRLVVKKAGWTDLVKTHLLEPDVPAKLSADFAPAAASIVSTPGGLAYELTNAHGLRRTGTTPAEEKDLPGGPVSLRVKQTGWPDLTSDHMLAAGGAHELSAEFVPASLTVTSEPPGAEIWDGEKKVGVTPAKFDGLNAGAYRLQIRLADHYHSEVSGRLAMREAGIANAILKPQPLWEQKEIDDFVNSLTNYIGLHKYIGSSVKLSEPTSKVSAIIASAAPISATAGMFPVIPSGVLGEGGGSKNLEYYRMGRKGAWVNTGNSLEYLNAIPIKIGTRPDYGDLVLLVGVLRYWGGNLYWNETLTVYGATNPSLVPLAQNWATSVQLSSKGQPPDSEITHRVIIAIKFRK